MKFRQTNCDMLPVARHTRHLLIFRRITLFGNYSSYLSLQMTPTNIATGRNAATTRLVGISLGTKTKSRESFAPDEI